MATANAATTFLENRLLSLIFKNNAASFSTPGDGIYVGSLPRRPLVGDTEGVLVGLSSEVTVGLEVGNKVGDAVGERDGALVLTGTFS